MAAIHLSDLDVDTCWQRLESVTIGRVGVTIRALPVVWPVFFSVFDESIVFRAGRRSKLALAAEKAVVVFEADHFTHESGDGWSVVVQGMAIEITDNTVLRRAHDLRLPAVDDVSLPDAFVVITPATISGRLVVHEALPGDLGYADRSGVSGYRCGCSPQRTMPATFSGLPA